jgi:starch synthase
MKLFYINGAFFMKILVICSESYSIGDSPLASAVDGIVAAYRRLGIDVLGFSPFYSQLANEKYYSKQSEIFTEKLGNREYSVLKNLSCKSSDLFICQNSYFGREGIYSNEIEKSYSDNHLRFSFLVSAALNYCIKTNFKPDAIHVHDWSGIAGALAKTVYKDFFANIPVLLTVHDIRYDCQCSPEDIQKIGLPPEGFDIDGYEFWGKVSLLKAAMLYSDKVAFTSANYLFSLFSTDLPGGMRGFLESHKNKLFGIQNGIDYARWGKPKAAENFKNQKKETLKNTLGLAADSSLLIYTHIDSNAGYSAQVISTILANLLNLNIQLLIGISEGDSNYPYFATIREKHSDRIALLPLSESDDSLYQRLSASDILFSINSSEPSLSLMLKAFAVGCVPVLNNQTQKPFICAVPFDINSKENINANVFISEDSSPDLVLEQIRIAESIFCKEKSLWERLVGNTSSVRTSWDDTVKNYLLLLESSLVSQGL